MHSHGLARQACRSIEPEADSMNVDIAIVGAGPAGLCFARALAGSGLSIALTHASRGILSRLGLWQCFDAGEVSELRDARVLNGDADTGLRVRAADGRSRQLGWLVPNQLIRRAAYDLVAPQAGVRLLAGQGVTGVVREGGQVALTLDGGGKIGRAHV